MKAVKWNKYSWRSFPGMQQPRWPDSGACEDTINSLAQLPPLVFAGESLTLKQQLADAVEGKAFVLHCGDCAEDFARCTGSDIRDLLKVILQMSLILTYAGEKRVIKIARIAGQYAKPRSSDTEVVNGIEIPSYRGDMVNNPDPLLRHEHRTLAGCWKVITVLLLLLIL